MNIKKYMVMTCKYRPYTDEADREFGAGDHGDEEIIPCFKYDNGGTFGRIAFDVEPNKLINRSTRAYIVIDKRVKEGDLIDDQVIKAVDDYTDSKGRFKFKYCAVV